VPDRNWEAGTVNDPMQAIVSLPAAAARMLAVEILLADPEALDDDVLESCLYLFREKLRTGAGLDMASSGKAAVGASTPVTESPGPSADASGGSCDEA
jgi:hypothetical protein